MKMYEEYQWYGEFGNKQANHWAGLDYIYQFTKGFPSFDLWNNLNKITNNPPLYGHFALDEPSKIIG